jgi:hypothetical protein
MINGGCGPGIFVSVVDKVSRVILNQYNQTMAAQFFKKIVVTRGYTHSKLKGAMIIRA